MSKDWHKITAVLLKPFSDPEVIHIFNRVDEFSRIVGGFIDVVPVCERKLMMIVNEEGSYLDLKYNRTINGRQVFGNILFVGNDAAAGDFKTILKPYEIMGKLKGNRITL